jgi:hypothetical protein
VSALAGGVVLSLAALEDPAPVLRIADLPDALAGQPDHQDDLGLPAALVVQQPDRVDKGGVGGFLARFVALVLARKTPHLLIVHDPNNTVCQPG